MSMVIFNSYVRLPEGTSSHFCNTEEKMADTQIITSWNILGSERHGETLGTWPIESTQHGHVGNNEIMGCADSILY